MEKSAIREKTKAEYEITKTPFLSKKSHHSSQFDDLFDMEILNKLKFFTKKLIEEKIDLTILNRNLRTLIIEYKKLHFHTILSNPNNDIYNFKNNTLYLNKNTSEFTLLNDFIIIASVIYDKDSGIIFSGFSQKKNSKTIGCGLNYGYQQYLLEKYFGYFNKESNIFVKVYARAIADLVSEEKMANFYFKADLHGLFNELLKYDSEDSILSLFSSLDYISSNYKIIDKEQLKIEKKNCFNIIMNCVARKYIIENPTSRSIDMSFYKRENDLKVLILK